MISELRDNWSGPAARTEDPPESHEAAARVDVEGDRRKVTEAFRDFGRPMTARWAAQHAVTMEGGTLLDTARVESLRRRVSDLKVLGIVQQCGKDKGAAVFELVRT